MVLGRGGPPKSFARLFPPVVMESSALGADANTAIETKTDYLDADADTFKATCEVLANPHPWLSSVQRVPPPIHPMSMFRKQW